MPNQQRSEPPVRVTVSLEPGDHAELLRLARQADVSLAWLLRRASREFIERHSKHGGSNGKRDVIAERLAESRGEGVAADKRSKARG